MPVVPISKKTAPTPPQIDPTFLEMAAASMHKEGKLDLNPGQANANQSPNTPLVKR